MLNISSGLVLYENNSTIKFIGVIIVHKIQTFNFVVLTIQDNLNLKERSQKYLIVSTVTKELNFLYSENTVHLTISILFILVKFITYICGILVSHMRKSSILNTLIAIPDAGDIKKISLEDESEF